MRLSVFELVNAEGWGPPGTWLMALLREEPSPAPGLNSCPSFLPALPTDWVEGQKAPPVLRHKIQMGESTSTE